MRARKSPPRQRRARARISGATVFPYRYYTAESLHCQARAALDQAKVHLANSESLLDDPDPRALGWACHLVNLADQAVDRAERAQLLAECCQAAGDLDGAQHWRGMIERHRAIYAAALEVIT